MNYTNFGFFSICLIIGNCRLVSSKYLTESESQLLEKGRGGGGSDSEYFNVNGLKGIKTCGSDASTLATPLSVYVSECIALPCQLNTVGRYDVYLHFIAEKDAPSLETILTGTYFGTRFHLEHTKDVCKDLVREGGGPSCPVQKGSRYLLDMEFDLDKLIMPSMVEIVQRNTIQLELIIRDPDKKHHQLCGVIQAEMI